MKILLIETAGKNPNISRIAFDDGSSVQTANDILLSMNLHVGSSLSNDELEILKTSFNYGKSLNYTLSLISGYMRSSTQVENKLSRRGVDPVIITEVISHLVHEGLIDDLEFAGSWIRSRRMNSPRSDIMIEYELIRKGISKELIEEAFKAEGRIGPAGETDTAWNSYEAKLRQYDTLPAAKKKRCITGFLKRKGFSWETVNNILERLKKHENI